MARWDGEEWSELGGGLNGTVFALASDGSNVYAGGHFTEAGGVPASKVAKWDGLVWSPLGSGVEGGGVTLIAVSGADLLIGGQFTTAGGKSSTNIALWHIPHSLKIRSQTDAVRLSWPATGSNFTLEAKEALQATTWSEVVQPPAVLNSELVVTQSVSGTSQLYQLHRR